MAAYQGQKYTPAEIPPTEDPETIEMLPSSLPSSSVVVAVPEPKDAPMVMPKTQVVQSPEPPILDVPGTKVKAEKLTALHPEHYMRENAHPEKNRFWGAYTCLGNRFTGA